LLLSGFEGRVNGVGWRANGAQEAARFRGRRAEGEAIMKAVVESAGKVASRTRLGNHELVFDQPATVAGGEDRGPSPLDVLAVSVAACAHYYAAAVLQRRGLSTEGLCVEVESEKERTPSPRLGRLSMKVRLPPGLSEGQLATVERAIKSCPAYGTLLHPPTVELTLEVPDGTTSGRLSA
jgi:putative redox protein